MQFCKATKKLIEKKNIYILGNRLFKPKCKDCFIE